MKKKLVGIIVIIIYIVVLMFQNSDVIAVEQSKSTGQTIEDGTYIIRSKIDQKFVLDVNGASTYNSANVQLYEYSNVPQKKYKVKYLGDGTYSIIATHSNKALDVKDASKAKGANVQQWEWNETDAQKWIIKDVGGGYYSIVSKCNGLYVDVLNAKAQNFQNIQMCDGNGLDAQKFKFEKVSESTNNNNNNNNTSNNNTSKPVIPTGTKTIEDGTYMIRSAIDTKFMLDINGASKNNGANVQLYEYSNVPQKKYKVKYLGDGTYSIIATHSNKSLDVKDASKAKGANVQQWEWNGTDAQKWIIKDAGAGYYSIISKCNGLYMDVLNAKAQNFQNIQMCDGNGLKAQKFKFEKVSENSNNNNNNNNTSKPVIPTGTKTIEDGTYMIRSAIDTKFMLDINGASKNNGANVQLYEYSNVPQKKYKVKYLGDGTYSIIATHSNKSLDVKDASKAKGANVQQWEWNGTDAQKWIIKDAGAGYYSIISKCNGLYMDVLNAKAQNFQNIQMCDGNGLNAQKFKFEKISDTIQIDTKKYPGYREKILKLMEQHPNWNFELLYTGLKFDDVIAGETAVHSRNLVPSNYRGEWICSFCGTKLYDSGWYCASSKAVAYYMDPRNFLDEVNVFQFLNVNSYNSGSCTLEGIKNKVNGTFLQNYAKDIDTACRNQNVNPYYIVSRVIQEQGNSGTEIGKGMDGGDGKKYYNPFNIGASGNGWEQIRANALATAKKYGWDSMEKALEGGITFCKKNWLDNYQNTLYQNKFDIDKRNGTNLYEHQYMQNLMGAYSEAKTLRGMYANTDKLDSGFTFIIPVYENMSSSTYPIPKDNQESSEIRMKVTANGGLNLRSSADTNSTVITSVAQGTIVVSLERGINTDWHKVRLQDGTVGYMSGKYLQPI